MCVCLSSSVTFFFLFLIQTLSSRREPHATSPTIHSAQNIEFGLFFSTIIFHINFSTLVQLVTLVHKWVHCLTIISNKFRIRTDYFGLVLSSLLNLDLLCLILSSFLTLRIKSDIPICLRCKPVILAWVSTIEYEMSTHWL